MDESDEFTFKDPTLFLRFVRKTACICLTATNAESYSGGIERNVLKRMQFRIFEKLLSQPDKASTNPEF